MLESVHRWTMNRYWQEHILTKELVQGALAQSGGCEERHTGKNEGRHLHDAKYRINKRVDCVQWIKTGDELQDWRYLRSIKQWNNNEGTELKKWCTGKCIQILYEQGLGLSILGQMGQKFGPRLSPSRSRPNEFPPQWKHSQGWTMLFLPRHIPQHI